MTVTDVKKDPVGLIMTMTCEFDAPADRVWQVWSDPRQLERWWGPPTYPATVVDHDLAPGSMVTYFMTGPEGDQHHGWWRVISVDPPASLDFEDGFADNEGKPSDTMPVTNTGVRLTETSSGATRMVITSKFASSEAMEQLLAMGMDEGMTLALGQIDALLAAASTA